MATARAIRIGGAHEEREEADGHEAKEDDVARAIVQHGEELRTDLIVLATHGRGGLRDLIVGSIAQRVLKHGTAPIFLVHPMGGTPPPFACRTILVPLDGTAAHEPALDAAVELGRRFGARLHLVIVVPTQATLSGDTAAAGVMMPLATSALLDLATEGAPGTFDARWSIYGAAG